MLVVVNRTKEAHRLIISIQVHPNHDCFYISDLILHRYTFAFLSIFFFIPCKTSHLESNRFRCHPSGYYDSNRAIRIEWTGDGGMACETIEDKKFFGWMFELMGIFVYPVKFAPVSGIYFLHISAPFSFV